MTTIAASLSRRMMAADARSVVSDSATGTAVAFGTTKLVRLRDWIVGAAGAVDDIDRFVHWLRRRGQRPTLGKGDDFEALLLSRRELLYVLNGGEPQPVRDGYAAIGSGGALALGSLVTQVMLGEDPDPRLAVMAACHHDPGSREPVDFLTWRVD